jgi:hypothetical protein
MYDKIARGFVKLLTIALFSEQERRMCQPQNMKLQSGLSQLTLL